MLFSHQLMSLFRPIFVIIYLKQLRSVCHNRAYMHFIRHKQPVIAQDIALAAVDLYTHVCHSCSLVCLTLWPCSSMIRLSSCSSEIFKHFSAHSECLRFIKLQSKIMNDHYITHPTYETSTNCASCPPSRPKRMKVETLANIPLED
jgi:hypothetical protein